MNSIYRLIFLVGYVAMVIMAVLPSGGNLSGNKVATMRLDYLLHFAVYLAIGLYFLIGKNYGLHLFRQHNTAKFIIAIILLAVGTELLQLAVPYRSFNPVDLFANLIGVAFGTVIILIQDRRSKTEDRRRKIEDLKSKIQS